MFIFLDDKTNKNIQRILVNNLNTEDFDKALKYHDSYFRLTKGTLSLHGQKLQVFCIHFYVLILSGN